MSEFSTKKIKNDPILVNRVRKNAPDFDEKGKSVPKQPGDLGEIDFT